MLYCIAGIFDGIKFDKLVKTVVDGPLKFDQIIYYSLGILDAINTDDLKN